MNNLTKYDLIAGVLGIGFIGTIIYAIDITRKLDKIQDKLGVSVDELVKRERIDIPDKVIEEAVEKAADREASYKVLFFSELRSD